MDLIRGIAAIAVMVGHLRGLFFVDFSALARKSVLLTALYAATGYGHEAVIVFFVLSGYFIGSSVLESLAKGRWSWRNYLVTRLTRLQLVLLPALVLGAVWDRIGMEIRQATPLYYGALYKFNGPSVALRLKTPVFFGNLFFLQSIFYPVFGSNGPLWSLSYEFWYYILFPILALVAASRVGTQTRVLCAILAAVLFWFIGPRLSLYFLIWLAGVLAGTLQRALKSVKSIPGLPILTGLVFAGSLAWCRVRPPVSDFASDGVVGFCFALWLCALLMAPRREASRAYASTAERLAGFSYTLYLTHFPVLLLLRGLIDPPGNWQPDGLRLAAFLAIAMLILAFAYGIALVTEGQTANVRRFLLRPVASLSKQGRVDAQVD